MVPLENGSLALGFLPPKTTDVQYFSYKLLPQRKLILSLITGRQSLQKIFLSTWKSMTLLPTMHKSKLAMITFFFSPQLSIPLISWCVQRVSFIFLSSPFRSYCGHCNTTHFAVHQLLVKYILWLTASAPPLPRSLLIS